MRPGMTDPSEEPVVIDLNPEQVDVLDQVVGDYRRLITERGEAPYVQRRYVLVGPLGVAQFAYMNLPTLALSPLGEWTVGGMMGTDVGYHSYEPQYAGHKPMDCDLLFGQDHCYYDGSGLPAIGLLKDWAEADWDEDWLWEVLEDLYLSKFFYNPQGAY